MFKMIKYCFRGLFHHKLRALLTMSSIAIGVFSIVVISTIGQIGEKNISAQLNGMGMDGIVISADTGNGLQEHDLLALQKITGVSNAMPLIGIYTQIQILHLEKECMLWGVNEDANQVISLTPVHGRLIHQGDVATGAPVCVIDEQLALETYQRSNVVGKTISVNTGRGYEKLTIVGVVQNGVNLLQNMLGDVIPAFVYTPYTIVWNAGNSKTFSQIVLKLRDNITTDSLNQNIQQTLQTQGSLSFNQTANVKDLLAQKTQLNDILHNITMILSLIGGISLIISGISIMTVMLVSVNERTREIGIKKAIGASNINILTEFLWEAFFITLVGGIGGILAGAICILIGCRFFDISFYISIENLIQILIFTLCIGLTFGIYPAFQAAKLKPVDALRTGD